MSFAREGLPLIVIVALVAAAMYALALNRRSWPLWLIAFALTIAALWVAYFFSDPRRPGPRGERDVAVFADSGLAPHGERAAPVRMHGSDRQLSLSMNQLNVPVDRFRVSDR